MKRVAIIGGGISGLAVLHYLKQRLGNNVEITLYEREASTGGTIRSFKKGSCLFEWGPNGFLDNQPATLQLIEELGASGHLIEAGPKSSRRFIQLNGKLQPIFPLVFKNAWPLLKGIFKKNISKDCSIYDYIRQRFSVNVAETLIDPMISGICAGNIKHLHMASAFPKMKRKGFKKPRMRSFEGGMGQIIEVLNKRYQQHIQTSSTSSTPGVTEVTIVATPAYAASKIVENINPVLSKLLTQISYAPVAVAGLLFKKDSFKKIPDGFGYLIPSKENKEILGVLIESNVYSGRAGDDEILLRVMMGGAHHPAIINDSPEQIVAKAVKEIDSIYGLTATPQAKPKATFVKQWPMAIPQYEINYPQWRRLIAEQCAKTPGLYLCANYLDGISFNDCIFNAKSLAAAVNI